MITIPFVTNRVPPRKILESMLYAALLPFIGQNNDRENRYALQFAMQNVIRDFEQRYGATERMTITLNMSQPVDQIRMILHV